MRYDETYSDLFDAAHDILEDVASKIGYCGHDGHLHDPYNDLVHYRKVIKENYYYCDRCDRRFSEDKVSDARMLWTIVEYHFEGFKPLIEEGEYRIYLSTVKADRRIELVAKNREKRLEEGMPKQIVLDGISDLKELPEQYSVEGESDDE